MVLKARFIISMKRIESFLLLVIVLLYSSYGFSCAERYWPLDQQIASLERYENVVVLKVVAAQESEIEFYSRTIQIDALIERSIKGELKPEEGITAYQSEDFSDIGCPVTLEVNERYLIPLEVSEVGYKFTRDAFHTAAEGREFENLMLVIAKD